MDGRVLKNSTPAEKSLMARPVCGSSTMPPGIEPWIKTPKGPNSDTAKRMVNPPTPENENPPSTPTKNTRSSTGVVVSKLLIKAPVESNFRIPPIKAASICPPKRSPFTDTPMDAISIIGNCPAKSLPTSILIPSIEPENSKPPTPCRPVTAADSVSTKSPGSFCISGQVMPISEI